MISVIHTRTGVNMGDHAQDVSTALDVTPETTLGELEQVLTRTRWRGADQPRDTDPSTYSDFIIVRIARPVGQAIQGEGYF